MWAGLVITGEYDLILPGFIPCNMNIIQDGLIYITCLFLLLATRRGFLGASRIRRFEQKHWAMLRLTGFLAYLNLGIILTLELLDVFRGGDPNLLLRAEVLVLFFVAIWLSLGMGKVRASLTHGKKYAIVFMYFGIALIIMILLLCYLKLWKYAGLIF